MCVCVCANVQHVHVENNTQAYGYASKSGICTAGAEFIVLDTDTSISYFPLTKFYHYGLGLLKWCSYGTVFQGYNSLSDGIHVSYDP